MIRTQAIISALPSPQAITAFVISLIVTATLWINASGYTDDQARVFFLEESHLRISAVQQHINMQTEMLRGVSAFFDGSEKVTRDEFEQYMNKLSLSERYSGQTFTFAQKVQKTNSAVYEARLKNELAAHGYSDYTLRLADNRDDHLIVEYVHPFMANLGLLGLDMFSVEKHRPALERARDKGLLTASAPLATGNDASTAVFLLSAPIYEKGTSPITPETRRRNLIGTINLQLRIADLFDVIPDEEKDEFHIEIYADEASARAQDHTQRVYFETNDGDESSPESNSPSADSRFRTLIPLKVGDRELTLTVSAQPEFFAFYSTNMVPIIVLGGGLTTSLLIYALTVLLVAARMQAESKLGQSRQQQQLLLDTLPDLISFKDPSGVYLDCNPAFAQSLGTTKANILSKKTDYDFLSKEMADFVTEQDQWVMTTRTPNSTEEWVSAPGNNTRAVMEIIKTPLYDANGHSTGILSIGRDITARKQAETELQRLNEELESRVSARTADLERINRALTEKEEEIHSLVDNLVDGVILTDGHGIVRSTNAAVERILGYRAEELIGQSVNLLMPAPHNELHDQYISRFLAADTSNGAIISREMKGRHKDNHEIPLEVAINGYQTNGEQRFTCILRDIRERKQIISQLEQAKEAAEASSRAKSAFLATMSHEIRTPMNGVIGMIELLTQDNLEAQQRDMVETARESSYSLLRIIDDILDFSKLEAGKLSFEITPISLEALIEGICDALESVATDKQVDIFPFIDPAIPRLVLGDNGRLRQILNNLVGNAIKFSASSRRRGQVAVRALFRGMENDKAKIDLLVADNGIGLSAEDQTHLFQPFTQADAATTRRFGGTGLGLSIVRRLVELMGGKVSVKSAPNEGATFLVSLSMTLPDATDAAGEDERSLEDVTCILITQNEERAHDLSAYLSTAGAHVSAATDQTNALQQRDALGPDDKWVLIHDTGLDKPQKSRLFEVAATVGNPHLLILLTHGRRHRARIEAPGIVSLDIELLHRKALLEAVILAASGLPSTSQTKPSAIPGHPTETPLPGFHLPILVVEDNATNRKVVVHQISLLGYHVNIAENGEQALELWKNAKYGMILSDLHMPIMDGFSLTAAIRQQEAPGHRVPIIAFTANILKEDKERCLEIGMDDFLTKPVQLPHLKATIEKWLPTAETQVPASPDPEDTSPSLDTSVLAQLIGSDDKSIIDEFLHDYLNSIEAESATLHAGLKANDLAAVGAAAHKMKSASRSVGAIPLGNLCEKLEKAGKAGDGPTVSSLIPSFDAELKVVIDTINKLT